MNNNSQQKKKKKKKKKRKLRISQWLSISWLMRKWQKRKK
jgi:hypothetical protein